MVDRSGRVMMLVDVENLHGGSRFTVADVGIIRVNVGQVSGMPPEGQVVVGASSAAGLVEAGLGWPGARRVWIPGRDGADLALADVALNEDVVNRFARVVICSGDGLFAVPARYLRLAGLSVTVVAVAGRLSRQLAATATDVRLLPAGMGRAA